MSQNAQFQSSESKELKGNFFIAPELFDLSKEEEQITGYENKSAWDVAIRFQDIRRIGNIQDKEKKALKKKAVLGIVEKAKNILGSVHKPEKTYLGSFQDYVQSGSRGELELNETLDHVLSQGLNSEALRFEIKKDKEFRIALLMDTSLSMTGEKIALLAVSVAVVAFCLPTEYLALMGFDSKIRWIKKFNQKINVESLIEKILELPAGGFTNLELALDEASKELNKTKFKNISLVLISDGKYTEGADPTSKAKKFRKLNVLKIGKDQAGRPLLLDLAKLGDGRFFEARKMVDLPKTMYGVVRSVLR